MVSGSNWIQLENSSTEVGSGSLQFTIFKFHDVSSTILSTKVGPNLLGTERELFLEFLEPPAKWFQENHGTSRKNMFHVKEKTPAAVDYMIFNFPNGKMTKKRENLYIYIYVCMEYYLRLHPNVWIILGTFPPTISLVWGLQCKLQTQSWSLGIRADTISILVHPLVNPKQFKSKTCLQLYCWWKNSCTTRHVWNPENNGIFTISTGAGFLPPTACIEMYLILTIA